MMASPLGFRVSGAFGTKAPIKYLKCVMKEHISYRITYRKVILTRITCVLYEVQHEVLYRIARLRVRNIGTRVLGRA